MALQVPWMGLRGETDGVVLCATCKALTCKAGVNSALCAQSWRCLDAPGSCCRAWVLDDGLHVAALEKEAPS